MGELIDVSVPVAAGMLIYPDDPRPTVDRVSDMERGASSNLSIITMSTHTGTHVDPPLHFVREGAAIDRLPLDVFVGPAHVADLRGASVIDGSALDAAAIPTGIERLLFLTDHSARWGDVPAPSFPEAYAAVTHGGAAWLIERGVRLVGTDFISIEAADDDTFPVHSALLGSGMVIVEGLDLREVPPGPCRFTCLPLKIRDGDGGPARAFVELGL